MSDYEKIEEALNHAQETSYGAGSHRYTEALTLLRKFKKGCDEALEQAEEDREAVKDLAQALENVPRMINASIASNYGRRQFVSGDDAYRIRKMCSDFSKHHAEAIKRAEEENDE